MKLFKKKDKTVNIADEDNLDVTIPEKKKSDTTSAFYTETN